MKLYVSLKWKPIFCSAVGNTGQVRRERRIERDKEIKKDRWMERDKEIKKERQIEREKEIKKERQKVSSEWKPQ